MSKQITAWNHPYNCDRHQPDSLRCIHMNLTANCRPGYTVSNRMRNKNNNARHACRQLTPVWIITSIGNHTNTISSCIYLIAVERWRCHMSSSREPWNIKCMNFGGQFHFLIIIIITCLNFVTYDVVWCSSN